MTNEQLAIILRKISKEIHSKRSGILNIIEGYSYSLGETLEVPSQRLDDIRVYANELGELEESIDDDIEMLLDID